MSQMRVIEEVVTSFKDVYLDICELMQSYILGCSSEGLVPTAEWPLWVERGPPRQCYTCQGTQEFLVSTSCMCNLCKQGDE
jgi:hypothetical protein